jgi:hypothetical protein
MKNGECPTWFVVKWLEKHPMHTANAPETSDAFESGATTTGYTVAFWTNTGSGWERCAPFRNDWTIYRGDGKPVRFKRKTKARVDSLVVTNEVVIQFKMVKCRGKNRCNVLIPMRKL